jgi:hypothetical protein
MNKDKEVDNYLVEVFSDIIRRDKSIKVNYGRLLGFIITFFPDEEKYQAHPKVIYERLKKTGVKMHQNFPQIESKKVKRDIDQILYYFKNPHKIENFLVGADGVGDPVEPAEPVDPAEQPVDPAEPGNDSPIWAEGTQVNIQQKALNNYDTKISGKKSEIKKLQDERNDPKTPEDRKNEIDNEIKGANTYIKILEKGRTAQLNVLLKEISLSPELKKLGAKKLSKRDAELLFGKDSLVDWNQPSLASDVQKFGKNSPTAKALARFFKIYEDLAEKNNKSGAAPTYKKIGYTFGDLIGIDVKNITTRDEKTAVKSTENTQTANEEILDRLKTADELQGFLAEKWENTKDAARNIDVVKTLKWIWWLAKWGGIAWFVDWSIKKILKFFCQIQKSQSGCYWVDPRAKPGDGNLSKVSSWGPKAGLQPDGKKLNCASYEAACGSCGDSEVQQKWVEECCNGRMGNSEGIDGEAVTGGLHDSTYCVDSKCSYEAKCVSVGDVLLDLFKYLGNILNPTTWSKYIKKALVALAWVALGVVGLIILSYLLKFAIRSFHHHSREPEEDNEREGEGEREGEREERGGQEERGWNYNQQYG